MIVHILGLNDRCIAWKVCSPTFAYDFHCLSSRFHSPEWLITMISVVQILGLVKEGFALKNQTGLSSICGSKSSQNGFTNLFQRENNPSNSHASNNLLTLRPASCHYHWWCKRCSYVSVMEIWPDNHELHASRIETILKTYYRLSHSAELRRCVSSCGDQNVR